MRKLHSLAGSLSALAAVLVMTGCVSAQHTVAENPAIERDNERYTDELSLNGVSVNIMHDGRIVSWGSGMLVGRGHVLTAAHVVDSMNPGDEIVIEHLSWRAKGHVEVIGDRATHDAAIVALDTPVGGHLVASPKLCNAGVKAGARLAVVTANGTEYTYGSPADVYERAGYTGTSATTTWFGPGASGSAVVDIERRCLLGVVSQSSRTAGSTGKDGKTIESVDQKTLLTDVPAIEAVVTKLPGAEASDLFDQ